jgi:hypothetical protein
MAAEIVAIVEHENSRGPGSSAIIPRRRKPADAAADHDQIVAFLNPCIVGVKIHAVARERMRDLE